MIEHDRNRIVDYRENKEGEYIEFNLKGKKAVVTLPKWIFWSVLIHWVFGVLFGAYIFIKDMNWFIERF